MERGSLIQRRSNWSRLYDQIPATSPLPCHPEIQTGEHHEKNHSSCKDCPSMIGALFVPFGDFVHAYRDEITALSTFVIAIFTTILGCFTISLARSTRTAARAADLSARAAITIELPIIRMELESFRYGKNLDGQNPETYYCSIRCLEFSNLGRTKAFPIEVQFGWFVGTKLPDAPTYLFTKSFPIGTIFEPEPETIRELNIFEFMFETKPGLYDRLRDKTESLWFFCSFAYLDFMQSRHDVGFCWERYETFGIGSFKANPTPAYNSKT